MRTTQRYSSSISLFLFSLPISPSAISSPGWSLKVAQLPREQKSILMLLGLRGLDLLFWLLLLAVQLVYCGSCFRLSFCILWLLPAFAAKSQVECQWGYRHICFRCSHASSSLTVPCVLASSSILCSPGCPALVTSLVISLTIPLQWAGFIFLVYLFTLTVTAVPICCLRSLFFSDTLLSFIFSKSLSLEPRASHKNTWVQEKIGLKSVNCCPGWTNAWTHIQPTYT